MILLRFLVLAFNAVVITFLVYEMIRVWREQEKSTRKTVTLIGGAVLLLSPLAMFLRIIPAGPQYFLIYPVAIALFIFLARKL